ncbi:MAG: adenylosuccinate lyase family protein [Alphaproteobacteria bacterium]|nr:adenylosuccinate lyase family protein [Alphaproteobacteria bacterium]
MTTSLIDSYYYKDLFTSAWMHTLFCDEARFQAWLDFEAALARAQARLGLIPQEAADEITAKAKIENIDIDAMKAEFDQVGFPISPFVHQLAKAVSPEAARYVHWGSTTQDVIDTGMVLQVRNGLEALDDLLAQLEGVLARLARRYRDTLMAGRTMQQQAAPITFGYKVAIWLAEIHRHRDRLSAMRPRVLVGQVGGAVGTNATLGEHGLDVLRETMVELGLGEAPITWHVSRDRWTEATMLLGLIGATLAKIGLETALLMRTEVSEIGEPFESGRGASSTLPQKRNPILCQPLVATGRVLREKTALALDAMVQDHERGIGPMHLEWSILPESFVLTGGALENAIGILDGLVVDEARMRANLDMLNGLIMSEAVMMGLAPHIGRNQAHDVVYEACAACADGGATLRDILLADARIAEHLSATEIDAMLDPSNYLGTAREMVDRVLADVDA